MAHFYRDRRPLKWLNIKLSNTIMILIMGVVMTLWKFIIKQMEMIREANRQFEIEHGMKKNDNE